MSWPLRIAALLAAPAALVADALPAPAGAAGAAITMSDTFMFEPGTVTIRAGETIEWRNLSHFKHTVTADPKLGSDVLPAGATPFGSGELQPGATFRQTLTVPGKYRFFCTPHEGIGMTGTITVLP